MPKILRRRQKPGDWFTDSVEHIICPIHKTKVVRWVNTMNGREVIDVAFLKLLEEIENNIIKHLSRFKNDINSLIEVNITNDTPKNVPECVFYSIEEIKECKAILETPIPISDVEIFEEFDVELDDDDRKLDALKKLLRYSINGSQSVTKDISTLISVVITKSLQTFYTASGKKCYGESKKAFCCTHTFKCMENVLEEKYRQSSKELQLKLKFSCWLSQNIFIQKRNKINNIEEL